MSKSESRVHALRSRRSFTREEIGALSGSVAERLLALPEFREARIVATYVAKADEVQTSQIVAVSLAGGKKLIVPRADPASGALSFSAIGSMAELSPGHFGVLEPKAGSEVPLDEADVVVVPVVAWDEQGHRLGYGRGFFDRALSTNPVPLRVGLALEAQKEPTLPQSPDDVPMDIVVTEARVLRFGRRQR